MSTNDTRNNAVSTYLEQEIRSEGSLARIARLYEMASLEVARARAGLAAANPTAKGSAINKASRVIGVLQSSLNMEQGGEVSRNLDRLYDYLLRRLSEGHRNNDDQALLEVARHLSELGSVWREVASQPTQRTPPAEPRGQAVAVP